MNHNDFDDIEGLESEESNDAPDDSLPMDRKRAANLTETLKRDSRRRLDDLLEAKRLRSNLGEPLLDEQETDSYYDDLLKESDIRKKEE